jgi:hypothetical protein
MALGRFSKAARPAPRKPAPIKPAPPSRGNVEQNYRGIPGLVNATAPIPPSVKPTPSPGLPTIPERGTGIPAYDNPRMISPGPTPPSGGATGSTGFKSAFGGIDSNMLSNRMKKGGSVKASKAPKASSASKRGDGIAIKGKTKGRFV